MSLNAPCDERRNKVNLYVNVFGRAFVGSVTSRC